MYDPFDEAFITTINDEYDAIVTTRFYDGVPGIFNKYEDETEWNFYVMSNPWNEIVGDVETLGVLTFNEALYAAEQKIDDFISVNR